MRSVCSWHVPSWCVGVPETSTQRLSLPTAGFSQARTHTPNLWLLWRSFTRVAAEVLVFTDAHARSLFFHVRRAQKTSHPNAGATQICPSNASCKGGLLPVERGVSSSEQSECDQRSSSPSRTSALVTRHRAHFLSDQSMSTWSMQHPGRFMSLCALRREGGGEGENVREVEEREERR